MRVLTLSLIATLLMGCGGESTDMHEESSRIEAGVYSYTVFKLGAGWGYDIYRNEVLIMHDAPAQDSSQAPKYPGFEIADSLAKDQSEFKADSEAKAISLVQ